MAEAEGFGHLRGDNFNGFAERYRVIMSWVLEYGYDKAMAKMTIN